MKKTLILNILPLLLFIQCRTLVVDIDIDETSPSLVINSTLVADSIIKVQVTKSKHIKSPKNGEFDVINDALITISENGTVLTTFSNGTNGWYEAPAAYKAKKGNRYNIKVEKKGFETATAQVNMPLEIEEILNVKLDEDLELIEVNFKDDKNKKNYYEVYVVGSFQESLYEDPKNPSYITKTIYHKNTIRIFLNDATLEEHQNHGESVFFTDALFNGKNYVMKLDISNLKEDIGIDGTSLPLPSYSKPEYEVYVRNTSKSYYLYRFSALLQGKSSKNIFSQPVIVYNNIKNGLGIFDAYSTTVYKIK